MDVLNDSGCVSNFGPENMYVYIYIFTHCINTLYVCECMYISICIYVYMYIIYFFLSYFVSYIYIFQFMYHRIYYHVFSSPRAKQARFAPCPGHAHEAFHHHGLGFGDR